MLERVLITGAAGAIGAHARARLSGRYPLLRLSDRVPLAPPRPGEECVHARLERVEELREAMRDIDAVVHLAGKAQAGEWDEVLQSNIIGLHNLFEVAREAGVRRVVFASSHHVVGFYRRGKAIGADVPIRPDSCYGVSKAFGEALGRLYADKHGMEVVCLRIGSFQPRPLNVRMLSTWVSARDMVELIRCALEAPRVHFEVAYGVSDNRRSFWDPSPGERLGYRPQDNAESYADDVLASMAVSSPAASDAAAPGTAAMSIEEVSSAVTANRADEPEASALFQGGPLCAMEFDGTLSKIE